MFWLDWDGSSGPILLPAFYPQITNAQGYADRPQFFQQIAAAANGSPGTFYKYPDSSPIIISTTAHAVAVPFQPGDNPVFYVQVLDSLSSLNLNSQWIIPVKLDNLTGIEQFNTAIIEYNNYVKYKSPLDKYISAGGHLVVTGANNTAQRELNANIKNSGLTFQVKAGSVTYSV